MPYIEMSLFVFLCKCVKFCNFVVPFLVMSSVAVITHLMLLNSGSQCILLHPWILLQYSSTIIIHRYLGQISTIGSSLFLLLQPCYSQQWELWEHLGLCSSEDGQCLSLLCCLHLDNDRPTRTGLQRLWLHWRVTVLDWNLYPPPLIIILLDLNRTAY